MPSSQSPNILILFTDQHQAAVLGAEKHPDVQTPNLDRLAACGVRFTRAYCQDAICAPSRNSLFSGLYPRTLGCRGNLDRSSVMDEVVPLPDAFRQAGYRTAAFGKRHLHAGCDTGWEIRHSHFIHESEGESYPDWIEKEGFSKELDHDWAAEWGRGMEGTPRQTQEMPFSIFAVRESQLPETMTMEAWTKQKTVQFIHEQKKSEQPFLCFASFYRPHQPYTPLPRYYQRFDRSHWGKGRLASDGIAMPATLRQPFEELPPMLQEQHCGKNRVWRIDLARQDEQIYRDYLAAYYALVEEIDDHVGEILKALEATGQLENTIIVYTSDHGDFVGAHGMVEKCAPGHNVYEETLRVPMIISWPGKILAGRVSEELVQLVDLYPTLLALSGVPAAPAKHPLQGKSLASHLIQGTPVGRMYLVSENWSQSTVITDRYKLGVWMKPENSNYTDYRSFGDQLFDQQKDPGEVCNLAKHLDSEIIEQKLRSYLDEWITQIPRTESTLPPQTLSA